MGDLLTVGDVASLLRVGQKKIYGLKREIGYVQVGKSVRFRLEDVDLYIRSRIVRKAERRKTGPVPRLTHIRV